MASRFMSSMSVSFNRTPKASRAPAQEGCEAVRKFLPLQVGNDSHNQTIIAFLVASPKAHYKSNVARWKIVRQEVYVTRGGRQFVASTETKVMTGDVVNVMYVNSMYKVSDVQKTTKTNQRAEEMLQRLKSNVLYRDNDILAINKPHSLPMQEGRRTWIAVNQFLSDLTYDASHPPKIIHRLDKDTTGVLLLARNDNTAARLAEIFRNPKDHIEKTYLAVLNNRTMTRDNGEKEITTGMAEVTVRGRDMMAIAPITTPTDDYFKDRVATTFYKVLATSENASYVQFSPLTGRKHQIRVHAASILKCPVVGDYKYGNGATSSLKGLFRNPATIPMHLHLREITLKDWFGPGADLQLVAPLPLYMQQTMRLLGFNKDQH
ncbi:hypothetical protein SeMB42_g05761 [Synchytrium endobioticum]|uniref:Pseudouridine synthase RsuA/RluA-like domain-containing protein n=1 Tax=Synchytrium endobioticum TaxID=286115 RepID=A0A507D412_9FUNG|nr:hypothetical protein SeMB42_g05761 [Synchytrium endobioticum]TPX46025.1 hypothetical protein SeLEV6574_g03486 [Synchytrium endobioticum]